MKRLVDTGSDLGIYFKLADLGSTYPTGKILAHPICWTYRRNEFAIRRNCI
jgi:hypothetical protein